MRRTLDGDVDQFPAGRRRADGLFPAGRAGPGGAGGSRRGARRADLDPRVQHSMARSSRRSSACPIAFASHFAPAMLMQAMAIYRERFRPSRAARPAPCHARGHRRRRGDRTRRRGFCSRHCSRSSLNNRIGRRGRVPPPVENFEAPLDPYARAILADALGAAIVGGPETVRRGLDDFIRRHRRRRADGDGQHLRPRQAQALVRDRRRSAWRDEAVSQSGNGRSGF